MKQPFTLDEERFAEIVLSIAITGDQAKIVVTKNRYGPPGLVCECSVQEVPFEIWKLHRDFGKQKL